jgi:hypothetical protein
MFQGTWTERVKENALGASELAQRLAQDKKFRKRLRSAVEHLTEARRRVRRGRGLAGAANQLAADQALQAELRDARRDLQQAYARLNAKRRAHRLRRIASLAGRASLAAVPQVREGVYALIATATRKRLHLQGLATTNDPSRAEAHPRTLEDLTKEELYARAQEAEIPGRSEMSKEELIAVLRAKG